MAICYGFSFNVKTKEPKYISLEKIEAILLNVSE